MQILVFYFCLFFCFKYKYSIIYVVYFLGILSEYTGITAIQVDGKRHYEGPMGKSDRALFISLLSIFVFFKLDSRCIEYLLILGVGLLLLTIYNRIKNSLKNIS